MPENEGSVREDRVSEEAAPFGDTAVRCGDERRAAVALDDQRVEVLGLLLGQAVESEVIQYQKVRGQVAAEDGLEAEVSTALAEFAQEQVGSAEENRVVCPGGGCAESLSQEGLADADRSDEQDVLLALKEVQGEGFVEMATVELDWRGPVEVLEPDLLLQAGGQESSFECEMVATLHFVGQDQREECGVIELLGTCQGKPVRQRCQELARLETAKRSGSPRRLPRLGPGERHAVAAFSPAGRPPARRGPTRTRR